MITYWRTCILFEISLNTWQEQELASDLTFSESLSYHRNVLNKVNFPEQKDEKEVNDDTTRMLCITAK